MKRLCGLVPVIALVLASALPANAAAPPGPYFNGFEKNTNGWSGVNGSTITRQPSGYSNAGGYADGIASASGNFHARLGVAPTAPICQSGSGPHPIFYGPITNWGGYSSTFPNGGYRTDLDIYLDVDWARANLDKRYDWSSAINDPSGNFRRDFVFNVGTDVLGFVIAGGNNANRCSADPADPGHSPVHVTTSGWYTFEHKFTGVQGGQLTVILTLTQKSTGTVVGTWDRSVLGDIIGSTVGGNRYGWFAQNEIPDLAIDNALRTGLCHESDGDGDVDGKDSGSAHFHHHAQQCEGHESQEQGDVEHSDPGSGVNFQSTSITAETFTVDESSQTLTMVGTGTDNGLPVGFTMIAVDNNGVLPSVYSLTLTDGYLVSGSLLDGALQVQ
jgi:hypothetical protein